MLSNFPTGLNWNVKGTADFNELVENLKKTDKAAEVEEPTPNKAALFAQINQGGSVTSSNFFFFTFLSLFFIFHIFNFFFFL